MQGSGWGFKSTGELDVDGDGRASYLEAVSGRPAEGFFEKGVDIAGEIVFDVTSWISLGASAVGRATLGSVGKGMNLLKLSDTQIAELGTKIAKTGTKGLQKVDLDDTVKYALASNLEDSKRLVEKYGTLATHKKFAANLDNLSTENIDILTKQVPDYMQDSFKKSVDDAILNSGLPENMVAYAAQGLPRGLKGLHRSGKAGPKFAGRTLPWKSGGTLGGNKITGQFFNPQTVRLMGGPTSPAYKAAMHALPNWRPRSFMSQEYSHAAVTAFKQYSRKAYQDQQWNRFWGRDLEMGIGNYRRIALAKKGATQIRNNLNEPGIRFVNKAHTPQKVGAALRKTANDSASPYRDFGDMQDLDNYLSGDKKKLSDDARAHFENKFGEEENWQAINAKHKPVMNEMMDLWRTQDNKRLFDDDFLEAQLPWEEYQSRFVEGPRKNPTSRDLRKYANDGEIMYLADDYVLKSTEESTLMSSRLGEPQRSMIGKGKQVLAGMQYLWSASALALTKGTTTIGTNIIGAMNAAMFVGLNPHMMVKNMPRAARLMKLQRAAHARIKGTSALKSHFYELTGQRVKKENTIDELRTVLNDKIATSTGELQEKMMNLRQQISKLEEADLKETSFIYALNKAGANTDEVVELLALGEFGVLSSSRTKDVLTGGLDETYESGAPVWNKIETSAKGVKGWATKLAKGDFETITKTLTLGSHVPTQMFEDYMRSLSFITARDMGATWDESWELVAKSQFDYQDLTLKEANFKSNWSRFYTYPRKLLGLMSDSIVNQPGRVASSTRAMFDSIKYLHDVTITDDGGYAEFLLPGWLERRPGVFQTSGVAGVVRLPLFEWAELMQSVLAIPSAVIPSEDSGLLSSKYLTDSKEAARQILGQISGFVPEAIKHSIEVATGRDSYSGRSLEPDDESDWWLRVAGIPLPGIAQGVNNLKRGIEISKDDDFGDRAAQIRLFSALISIWERGAEEIDGWALSEVNKELEDAIQELSDNGVDVATLADLTKADAIEPQTEIRLRLYGQELEKDHPDFDEKKPRNLQRRMVTEQEWIDRLAGPYAERLGLEQTEDFTRQSLTNADYRVAVQKMISKDILDSYTEEAFADYLVRTGVASREQQKQLGISPSPLPQADNSLTEEEQQRMALEQLRRGGMTLEQAQIFAPYLNSTVYKYRQLVANGMGRNLARFEIMKDIHPDARNLLEPGFVPEVEITGLPYTVEELQSFAARAQDLGDEIELIYGLADADAELLARYVLMKGAEQEAILGARIPSGTRRVDSGINRRALNLVKAQQRATF